MQEQSIADEEPDDAPAWSGSLPAAAPSARRIHRSAAVDEWLRRQVRRLLEQVRAAPSPSFIREHSASRGDSTVRAVAAIVFFLLVLCLALTTWQWRATRAAAITANEQAARTAASRDFLAQLLSAASTPSTQGETGRSRIKDVLDAATPRVGQQFGDDPRTQSELLGVLASNYRQLGQYDSSRALLALQRVQLRRVYGDAHPILIRSLLDEAESEIARRDLLSANARLKEADPLIKRARLDEDAMRARWWMLGSDAQPDTAAAAQALDRAIVLFERQRPVDARLADALTRKAWRVLPTQPAQAELLFARVAELSGNAAARRHAALLGLAQAREGQGEYETALQALDQARSLGRHGPIADARFAWTLHREGQRERALAEFDALVRRLAPDGAATGPRAATWRSYYAESLAAEGRPMQAIPLLEAAATREPASDEDAPDIQRALLALGDAYDRAGLWTKARETLKASLDLRLRRSESGAGVAEARERWGRFLLGQGEFDDAQEQFDAVLDQASGRNVERAVLAYGGLARVALAHHDWDAALTASTHAVVGFENLVGARDVRSGPYLWLIHAEALRSVDDFASARIWATRALDASRRYDAPDAASIREAEAVMARLVG